MYSETFIDEFNQFFADSASLKRENGQVELTIGSRTIVMREPQFEIVGAQATGQLSPQLLDTHRPAP